MPGAGSLVVCSVGRTRVPGRTARVPLTVGYQASVAGAGIHNAGVDTGARILPVNVVAPYLLTALIRRPARLIYLSSGMHHGGRADVRGRDWAGRRATASYSDSKLFVTVPT
ncbi:hypothetical protein [Amycolatopsis thermoflava]|uniref:hypothetical protein n=1 Tax=Amycolatopsis thermoflava TaxID=84480 RepID=UPI003D71D1E5